SAAICSRRLCFLLFCSFCLRSLSSFPTRRSSDLLFGLPFKFCLQLFLPLGVSGIPNGLVIFDLVFDHGVEDHCDLMGGCHGGSLGAQLGFHSTQVVARRK